MSALFKAPRPEELPQRFDNPAGPSQPSDTAQKLLLSPEELIAAAGRRAAGLPGHTPLAGAPSPRQQASLGVEPNSPAAASEAPGAPTPNPAGTEALAAEEPRTRVKVQEDERASDEAEGAYAKKLLRDDPSFAIEDVYNDKTLNLGAKRRLLEMAKNIPLPEPSAEDSKAAAADLLGRIRRPSGDPEKITGRAPITEAFNAHKLTKADFELVEQELADSRTPDGERLAQRKQAFVESRSPSTAPGDTGAATEPAPAPIPHPQPETHPMPALTQDNVLLWLHGRRVGLVGDGSFSASSGLMVDSQLVGGKRGPVVSQLAAGNNGVGSVSFPAAVDGDVVLFALDLTTPANVTSSFEAVISVAGQIKQTSASNLSGKNIFFQVQPAS